MLVVVVNVDVVVVVVVIVDVVVGSKAKRISLFQCLNMRACDPL